MYVKVKIVKIDGTVDTNASDECFINHNEDIGTFKSYLLRLTENQPFYFKHHMQNSESIKALIERTE